MDTVKSKLFLAMWCGILAITTPFFGEDGSGWVFFVIFVTIGIALVVSAAKDSENSEFMQKAKSIDRDKYWYEVYNEHIRDTNKSATDDRNARSVANTSSHAYGANIPSFDEQERYVSSLGIESRDSFVQKHAASFYMSGLVMEMKNIKFREYMFTEEGCKIWLWDSKAYKEELEKTIRRDFNQGGYDDRDRKYKYFDLTRPYSLPQYMYELIKRNQLKEVEDDAKQLLIGVFKRCADDSTAVDRKEVFENKLKNVDVEWGEILQRIYVKNPQVRKIREEYFSENK